MKPVKHRATIICRHGKQTHKWLWVRKPNAAWTLPGGKIEPGETPVQAAERELLEETGLQAESLTLLMRHETAERMHYVFEAEFAEDAYLPGDCGVETVWTDTLEADPSITEFEHDEAEVLFV